MNRIEHSLVPSPIILRHSSIQLLELRSCNVANISAQHMRCCYACKIYHKIVDQHLHGFFSFSIESKSACMLWLQLVNVELVHGEG